MRDRYYRIIDASDRPDNVVVVHIWHADGVALARIQEDGAQVAAPDLVLFQAALQRMGQNLVAIFVLLEDPRLWLPEWGDLVDYRITRKIGKPALRLAQSPAHITGALNEVIRR